MKKFCFLLLLLSTMFTSATWGQKINRDSLAIKVGAHVDSVGEMRSFPLKYIVEALYKKEYTQVEMTYAIYSWIGKNVYFDTWAYNHARTANHSASDALNKREATSMGFANLFKAMCDLARIECVVIDGTAKAHAAAITSNKRVLKHYWNAVKIKNTWYYADATFAAGYTDRKVKIFTKEFTDVWCFGNRELFTLSHFPNDKKWQFADEPVTKSAFAQAPVIGAVAMKDGIYWANKVKGKIRAKVADCKRLVFELPYENPPLTVSLLVKEKEVTPDYYVQGKKLYVDVPFTSRGKYPVIVNIGGKQAFAFQAEVAKKKKRA